jgi:hypothetical protein
MPQIVRLQIKETAQAKAKICLNHLKIDLTKKILSFEKAISTPAMGDKPGHARDNPSGCLR